MADKYYIILSGRQKRGDKVSPRTGRPKSENPKNNRITVRLDKQHTEILEAYCKEKNVEKAEAIRTGILKLKSDIKK